MFWKQMLTNRPFRNVNTVELFCSSSQSRFALDMIYILNLSNLLFVSPLPWIIWGFFKLLERRVCTKLGLLTIKFSVSINLMASSLSKLDREPLEKHVNCSVVTFFGQNRSRSYKGTFWETSDWKLYEQKYLRDEK